MNAIDLQVVLFIVRLSVLHQGDDLSMGLVTTISDTDGLLLPLPFAFFRAVDVG
jgi:hypothetical protein